ncbi:hypothetical protein Ddye_020910 [Dipteronia dyeriana]|uniref:Uncharacterized protein n=1 Tax=Dipteronia dyeriana TaxID=168575 RepID=A0AAD9U1N8_9ROSI|nr:hypothetical protein Ddye_020910 [Dipteronia dyeriana]
MYPHFYSSTKPYSSSLQPKKPVKKSSATQKKKQPMLDQYKPVLYTSLQTSSFSESASSESSQSSWETNTAISYHQSDTDVVTDLTQIAGEVPSVTNIESIFSEQENVNQDTTFMLKDSDSVSISEFFDSSNTDTVLESYQAPRTEPQSGPQVPIQILSEKYSKLVNAIVYFDTDSHNTMMNPKLLPAKAWKSYVCYFKAADGQIFTINLVSKNKIDIKIFPSYTLWVRVIGIPLPDKDILIA